MSETRTRNAKGQLTSRTIQRNPGPQRPEVHAAQARAAEAEKVAAAAEKKDKTARRGKDKDPK